MNAELLLASVDDHRPLLEKTLPLHTVPRELPERTEIDPPSHLYDHGGDPESLELQRWGLVVPEGSRGDTLLGYVERLREARKREQNGAEPQIYRVPPQMSLAQARDWKYRKFRTSVKDERELPRYLLVLGDLDEVSLELQQALSSDGFVGRLAFPDEAGYTAYVDKVLRWEQATPTESARALFFTAHDQTVATGVGYRFLVTPSLQHCRSNQELGYFRARDILEVGQPEHFGRDLLLAEAAVRTPSVLFSLTHGMGPPRRGGWSDEEQRKLQGSMCIGTERLLAEDVTSRDFLPGGFWFYFACFGAGTPSRSCYYPWLKLVQEEKGYPEPLDVLQSALARKAPFVSALPQAALANPNGPLAVIGHVDLAWTYAFLDNTTGQTHPSRFTGVLREIVAGRRAGQAIHALWRFAVESHVDLATRVHDHEYARATHQSPNPDREPWPNQWMSCQDLSGYMLLGDPAARLPLARPQVASRPSSPSRSMKSEISRKVPRSKDMEQAVLALLMGDHSEKDLAEKYGTTKAEIRQWRDIYKKAGRRALRKLRKD